MLNIDIVKLDLITQIDKRLEDNIIEHTNAMLLKKLIQNAETVTEAMMIAELGTTYKRTGFHFDKRLEKIGDDIKYLKKNEELSFVNDKDKLTHKLIIGDNYDALQNLLVTHRGKIDVIYIDPPYGKDDMGAFAQMHYNNNITRDNLLSMLYPRLQLAKQLLTSDGVIFCSIDDKNYAYLKCMFDEIFMDKNIDTLIWNTEAEGNSGNIKKTNRFRGIHEYIIIGYSCKKTTTFNKINEALESSHSLQTSNLAKNNKDKKGDVGRIFNIINPENGMSWIDEWKFSKHKIETLQKEGLLYFGKYGTNKPRVIIPTDDRRCVYLTSILNYGSSTLGRTNLESVMHNINECNKGVLFSNPKPIKLLLKLFSIISNKDAIILDFFAGSGTTGQAVMELNREDSGNRTFILCTNNEVTEFNQNGIAVDVTSKRLKRTMSGECYDGTSNFKWLDNNAPYGDNLDVYDIETVNSSEQLSGKSPLDVIDETVYGIDTFKSVHEKIDWLCNNFDNTKKYIDKE